MTVARAATPDADHGQAAQLVEAAGLVAPAVGHDETADDALAAGEEEGEHADRGPGRDARLEVEPGDSREPDGDQPRDDVRDDRRSGDHAACIRPVGCAVLVHRA